MLNVHIFFVSSIFVASIDYENIFTTKLSRFTVCLANIEGHCLLTQKKIIQAHVKLHPVSHKFNHGRASIVSSQYVCNIHTHLYNSSPLTRPADTIQIAWYTWNLDEKVELEYYPTCIKIMQNLYT